MGHEASGVVDEVGQGVAAWKPGDRVTFDSTVSCGKCWFCSKAQTNLCESRRVLGVACEDYSQNGAFAEYLVVPQRALYLVPAGVSFEHAAMTEPLSVALHAVKRAPSGVCDLAVVIGAGTIGLLALQALRANGCREVVAVDLDPARLELARRLGARRTIRSDQTDVVAEIMRLTQGRGADIVCEAVGLDLTVSVSIASVRKGGSVVLVGNISPSVELPLQVAVTRELTLFGSCASSGEYPACLDLLARGAIDMRPMITAVAPLSQGKEWFQRLYDREPGMMKVILTP
jgi:L-iditol 2-dehydrogenase